MTTTALIAEDEVHVAADLRAELALAWPELAVVAVVSDGHRAIAEALRLRPAVCFLDIRMPGPDGLEVARCLTEDWSEESPAPLSVIVTAYDDRAVEAFELGATDYLLKPFDALRLAACVRRLRTRLGAPAATAGPGAASVPPEPPAAAPASGAPRTTPPLQFIAAQVGTAVRMVPIDRVIYFQATDKYVRVVTTEGEHLIRTPIRELLPRLDPQIFWQVHRSTVVQARWIESAQRDDAGHTVLRLRTRRETIPVSRLHAQRFRRM